MKGAGLLLLGAAAGFVAARFLINPSSCCSTLQKLVSQKIGDKFGSTVEGLADATGLTDAAPGVLGAVYS